MEKHVYVWRPPEPQIRIFARAGRDAIERRLDGAGLRTVVVHTTHVPPPALSLVPFRRSPMALVSMHGDETALAEAGRRLGTLPGRVEGYAVEESVPIACARPPRATLVTLFRRAPRVSTELFLRRWHGEHTPMTLEIHPVVGYVRNVVRAPLAPDAPPGTASSPRTSPSSPTSPRCACSGVGRGRSSTCCGSHGTCPRSSICRRSRPI